MQRIIYTQKALEDALKDEISTTPDKLYNNDRCQWRGCGEIINPTEASKHLNLRHSLSVESLLELSAQ